ncbi:hypothetical protein HANVADRAFT_56264 [Hanseniaspora valbyensis NRRL Y-1626]|uniref:Ubiquitin-activating enzyme E1-like n=1 Tax=Hanseniaspora valbyensis NRRL Y-1626 TaxID=766949 RepID=A0A1B7TCZ5_9ASCO|nr:hypothetical protein HANVADRAFT_56264 [Hanseniaspora valbyensis NRRL Y-1626]
MISDLETVYGKEGASNISNAKILMVGAGGIGCELLKNLVLLGFKEIHVVDMDTIDLSNLNRQFLFRFKDIKNFKSKVACNLVEQFKFANFKTNLISYTENIMNFEVFDIEWFEQFDIIMNALDNLEARRYINKICQYVNKPLMETGTSGFDGYAMPMQSKITECFDCTAKETPVTFPVCTIRSTPSQPVHCIVWAKNFLFQQLFGEIDEHKDDEKDYGTEDEEEIARIKSEQNELNELVKLVRNSEITDLSLIVEKILNKIFLDDIKQLLKIDTLWKTRTPPTIISIDDIDFKLSKIEPKLDMNKDWSLKETIEQFVVTTKHLIKRQRQLNGALLEFDKDDLDTLLFVATAANIRSEIFSIVQKTVFDIKQIAGNIIPAIATTNAIIASFSTLNALKLLTADKQITDLKSTYTSWASGTSNKKYMSLVQFNKPNPECTVCSKVNNMIIKIGKKATLSQLIKSLKEKFGDKFPEDFTIMNLNGSSIVYDFDFEDLLNKNLFDIFHSNSSDNNDENTLQKADFLLILDEDMEDDINKPLQILLQWDKKDGTSNAVEFERIELIKYKRPQEEQPVEEESENPVSNDTEFVVDANGDILLSDSDKEEEEVEEPPSKKQKIETKHINENDDSDIEIILD